MSGDFKYLLVLEDVERGWILVSASAMFSVVHFG